MNNKTKIIVNTLAQYIRTGANVILTLYATRLVLEALGSNQYGIYTLVGGIVSMLSFFTNALTTTTQRYLSYHQEQNNLELLRSYFFNSVAIHAFFGGILAILLFVTQPLLFSGFLNIEPEFLETSKWVYIIIVLMLFIAMMTSPFRAVLIARENIFYISIVDIIDGVFKFLIGFCLFYFASDRLIWYAILMGCVSVFNLLAMAIYSIWRFPESRNLKFQHLSKYKIKELTGFAGWTIYGTLCLFGRVQGIAIVLNKFFNTVVNAAYGVAQQISSALTAVSGALQTAIAPQLIKSEGANNRDKMLRLSIIGCKVSFILMTLIGLPIIFYIKFVLKLWLTDVPQYTAYLSIMLVVSNLVDQLTIGFNQTMNAIGKVKLLNLSVNTLKFMTVFILPLLLWLGIRLELALVSYVVIELLGSVIRVIICHKTAGLNIRYYSEDILLRLCVPTLAITILYYISSSFVTDLWSRLFAIVLISLIYLAIIYIMGLDKDEKSMIHNLIRRR